LKNKHLLKGHCNSKRPSVASLTEIIILMCLFQSVDCCKLRGTRPRSKQRT